jgi:two-component system, OmpR family, sensor histidine kinase KdpD
MDVPNQEELSEGIRREARVVGLREFRAPSLETVERRRLQLWILTTVMLVSVSLGVVALSIWPVTQKGPLSPSVLRASIVLLSVAFCAYGIEKERHLHRLSRLLVDERVLSTALTNRLHEVSLLLDAGRAINSVLELENVLETILRSAIELLGGTSGSIMLLEGEELVTACVQANEGARGRRVRLGEGIAGRVAQTREPLLIDGHADPADFPGLAKHDTTIESAISTPLVSRDEVVGVLNVNAASGRVFTEYDMRAMSVFAEQAASAIANARLYETERQHVAELIKIDRMKSEFAALVSHELRTPITGIIAAVATAARPEMSANQPEMFDIIDRQARRLDDMVEDLLTSARLERPEFSPRAVVVDAAAIARVAASDALVSGQQIEVTGAVSALALGDDESLRRIIDNLIGNASKYGAPPVRLDVAQEQGRIVISVLDGGPGIPKEDRDRVFERFQRLEQDRSRPGIGLGLSIVRGLVRALGGVVWVEDAPSGGAAFRVALREATRAAEAV